MQVDMDVEALRLALRQHRLDRNLSYEELAADIARTVPHHKLALRTVYSFVEGETAPQETTTFAVWKYLKTYGIAA